MVETVHVTLADMFSAMGSFLVSDFVNDAVKSLQAPPGACVHGSLEGTHLKQNFWVLAEGYFLTLLVSGQAVP